MKFNGVCNGISANCFLARQFSSKRFHSLSFSVTQVSIQNRQSYLLHLLFESIVDFFTIHKL